MIPTERTYAGGVETREPSRPDMEQTAPASAASEPSAGELARKLGPAGVLGVLWTVLPVALGFILLANANTVGNWLRTHESNGPLIYAAGFMVMSGLGLLPTYASAILGGWAFGVQVGFPAALCGFTGGAVIGYLVARSASGDRVEKIIAENAAWRSVRDALLGGSYAKTLMIVTLLRLPPNSPFALTNLVLASVKAPWSAYVIGTVVGMAPRTLAAVWIASTVREMTAHDAAAQAAKQAPAWVFIAGIAVTVAVLATIGLLARSALRRVTAGAPAQPVDTRGDER